MDGLTSKDIALTGVPRGGTTLCCQLLQRSRQTIALFEPMDVHDLPEESIASAVDSVVEFYADVRRQIQREGTAPSKQVGGQLPDNPFSSDAPASGRRRLLATPGVLRIDPRPADGFTLAIKHNAAFAALLPQLASRIRTLAVVRNPLSVLASWNSVDLPVTQGRLPAGERLDPGLASSLRDEPDPRKRQLLVLEWFFARFDRCLSGSDVLRYEDVVASQGEALRARAGVEGIDGDVAGLRERNNNPLYARESIPSLCDALERRQGSWQRWYSSADIRALADRICGAGNTHAAG